MHPRIRTIANFIDNLSPVGRMVLVLWGMALFVVGIIFTLGRYTIIDHDFYSALADKQQIRNTELAVNRGTIFGTLDPRRTWYDREINTIVATTLIAKDLKIDPSALCNLDMLETFLLDITYRHLCENRSQVSCIDNIMKYTNTYTMPPDFIFSKESILSFIAPVVREQSHRMYKTRISLASWVSVQDLDKLLALQNPGIVVIADGVFIDPTRFDKSRGVAEILDILRIDPVLLDEALKPRQNRNVDIIERMEPELSYLVSARISTDTALFKQQTLITQAEQEKFLTENTIYKCLKLTDNPVRQYPAGPSMAQVTWFVDRDGIGRLGIEWYFQDLLAGKTGKKEERRDSLGRPIFDEEEEQEVKWVDLYLTIDPNIQNAVMDALKEWIRTTGANTAAAIVMDPKTWAIRAVGSYPSFDPERPGNVDTIIPYIPSEHPDPVFPLLWKVLFVESLTWNVKKIYQNKFVTLQEISKEDEMRTALANPDWKFYIYENQVGLLAHQNIAITSPYEPGSIFKWITAAVGLDTGEIEPDMMYQDAGSVKIDEFEIKNLVNAACQWYHSFRNAINYSCNVGMINIIQRVGKPLFYEYLKRFWFLDITWITLDWEHTGALEPYEKWSRAKLFTMSFWQGIQVNLVQMASIYSAFANGGILMQPYTVQKKVYPDGDTVITEPIPIKRVIGETTSQKITAMLTDSTKQWFAKAGAVPGYTLAGKTGTSQIASSKWGFELGQNGRTNTSYAGFGPSKDPQFVIIVRFDRPRSTQFAEQSSAKTFKDIASFLLEYYGIPPER